MTENYEMKEQEKRKGNSDIKAKEKEDIANLDGWIA